MKQAKQYHHWKNFRYQKIFLLIKIHVKSNSYSSGRNIFSFSHLYMKKNKQLIAFISENYNSIFPKGFLPNGNVFRENWIHFSPLFDIPVSVRNFTIYSFANSREYAVVVPVFVDGAFDFARKTNCRSRMFPWGHYAVSFFFFKSEVMFFRLSTLQGAKKFSAISLILITRLSTNRNNVKPVETVTEAPMMFC